MRKCALPPHGIDAHAAAQLPYFFMHDIHADAPPGNLGDFLGCGEPWLQDELQHVAVADLAVRIEQTALDRLASHRLQGNAGTVVADIENDVAALAQQIEGDPSPVPVYPPLFAPRQIPGHGPRHLRSMCSSGAAMRSSVAIHLAFSVFDDELDVLAQLFGHLTNDALQAR